MRKPRFIAADVPSLPQFIDIEEWKKERNEEMKAISTVTLYKKEGRFINVNEDDVKSYVEMEDPWSLTPIADKPIADKPVATKVIPKPISTAK